MTDRLQVFKVERTHPNEVFRLVGWDPMQPDYNLVDHRTGMGYPFPFREVALAALTKVNEESDGDPEAIGLSGSSVYYTASVTRGELVLADA